MLCMLFCFAACNQRKNNTNTIKSIPDINSYKNDSIVYSNQLLYQDSLKLQEPIGNKITVYRSKLKELQFSLSYAIEMIQINMVIKTWHCSSTLRGLMEFGWGAEPEYGKTCNTYIL